MTRLCPIRSLLIASLFAATGTMAAGCGTNKFQQELRTEEAAIKLTGETISGQYELISTSELKELLERDADVVLTSDGAGQSADEARDRTIIAMKPRHVPRETLSLDERHREVVVALVLTELATRLKGAVREVDVVGRFGGDEFVIVAPGLSSEAEAMALDGVLYFLHRAHPR